MDVREPGFLLGWHDRNLLGGHTGASTKGDLGHRWLSYHCDFLKRHLFLDLLLLDHFSILEEVTESFGLRRRLHVLELVELLVADLTGVELVLEYDLSEELSASLGLHTCCF